jgi:hypothetical protein
MIVLVIYPHPSFKKEGLDNQFSKLNPPVVKGDNVGITNSD